MAGDYDYPGVATPDDEDEELLKRFGGYPAPAPLNPAATPAPAPPVSAPAPAPAGGASPYPAPMPAPVAGSTEDLEARADQPRRAISDMAAPAPAPPQWKDYAPAEPHGWSKLGHVLAALHPLSNNLVNVNPMRAAEQKYSAATNEFKENQGVGAEESKEGLEAAQTENQESEARARDNPQPKIGDTPEERFMNDALHGEKGNPKKDANGQPYNYLSAHQAWKQAEQDTKPDPAVKDKQQDIGDYLSANSLTDTSANREKARKAIADRGKTEPGNFMPLYDEKGHVTGAWDPKSGRVVKTPEGTLPGTTGQGLTATRPTTQMRNVEAQAGLVHEQMPSVIAEIQDMKDELGPVEGRWNEFMQGKVGLDNPKFAGLRTDLLMMSSAIALMHARGRLPENLREEFDNAINAPKQTAGNLVAVLQHIDKWTSANMNAMGGQQSGGGQNAGGAQGGGAVEYKPGLVRNGYKFKGGDATDKNNWEKVKEEKK